MHFYTAYNLYFSSELPLPELLPCAEVTKPDVTILLGKIEREQRVINGGDCFLGEVPQVGFFLVEQGRTITIDCEAKIEISLLRTLILGPIMSVVLRQRGLLVLHASSFAVGEAAIAFLGSSGCGKSTLVEAFHQHGYDIITDDVMGIAMHGDYPMVLPSFPQIKLWPEAALAMGHSAGSLPPLHDRTEKLIHRLENKFTQYALPLKRIYALEPLVEGVTSEILPLSPQAGFVEVLRNSRAVSLLQTFDFVSPHFYQCTELVNKVPISLLRREYALAAIPKLIQLIEVDIAANMNLGLSRQAADLVNSSS